MVHSARIEDRYTSFWFLPTGSLHILPPRGLEPLPFDEHRPTALPLSRGEIPGLLHELVEQSIRHLILVQIERIDVDFCAEGVLACTSSHRSADQFPTP